MKAGLKDKISQYVDFTYGYGSDATLGFKAQKDTLFPITLIPRNIDEFVSQKYKIVFDVITTATNFANLSSQIKFYQTGGLWSPVSGTPTITDSLSTLKVERSLSPSSTQA